MEASGCSVSISTLICEEDGADLEADDDSNEDGELFLLLKEQPLSQSDEEYVEKLISKETNLNIASRCCSPSSCDEAPSMLSQDWFVASRIDSIRWILRTRACFGFSYKTAYLAISFFDRFCLRRTIEKEKSWAIQLLSIACLSLAAKIEEERAPLLSEYRIEEHAFRSNAILRMELLVLSTLEWRAIGVTPFDYLSYFVNKFQCRDGSKHSIHEAVGFIFAIIEVISILDYRPSTIAAAAILAASNEGLTKELVESKMATLSLCGSLDKEHVYACYNAMNEESKKKHKESRRLDSSDLSENCTSVTHVIDLTDTASFTSTSNKRRRLQLPNIN
ncbi:Cyclin-D5-3 [Ananas comosus]|uniref:Cyclin-D5-3 n=1 Tax=Ananas comosus TaxID=4615 RepID=A0A199VW57_ANACO|nr:Cyclin-D5-3 [Ananas comosus]